MIKEQYKLVSPKKLKAHPLNAQLFGYNDTNYDDLKKSIQGNGFFVNHPILCYQNGKSLVIISGHQRWKAAIELGIDPVPVTIISNFDDSETEQLMIEENLLRPQEGRKLSQLERYILALRLSSKFPERRGGDRRSADFIAKRSDIKLKDKDTWLAEKTGLCVKYISELNVIAKKICEETSKAYPELLDGMPLYEQLQIIINHNLSADLSDLNAGTILSTLYKKYRTPKPKQTPPELIPEKHISSALPDCADDLEPQKNIDTNYTERQDLTSAFIRSFINYLSVEFATNANLSKTMQIMQILSLPHQDHVATLIAVKKVVNLLLHTAREQGSKAKNIEAQSLPLFNNNGGLK